MIRTNALLVSKKNIAPDTYHLFFRLKDEMGYEPGQYVILDIPSSPTPLKRLYSFAGSNEHKNMFELLIKLVPGGASSEYIKKIAEGETIDVTGPAGLFRLQNTQKRKIYMVTGTGFAPIRSFLTSNVPHALNSVLFWGLKDLANSYMIDELAALHTTTPSFNFYYCLSQQSSFETIPAYLLQYFRTGHIDTVWGAVMPEISALDEYYLCGSRTVIESLRIHLLERGVAKESLFFEKY